MSLRVLWVASYFFSVGIVGLVTGDWVKAFFVAIFLSVIILFAIPLCQSVIIWCIEMYTGKKYRGTW